MAMMKAKIQFSQKELSHCCQLGNRLSQVGVGDGPRGGPRGGARTVTLEVGADMGGRIIDSPFRPQQAAAERAAIGGSIDGVVSPEPTSTDVIADLPRHPGLVGQG